MTIDVRPARAHELDGLHELAAATFPLACPPHLPTSAVEAFVAEHLSVEAFAAHLAHPDHRVLVADLAGRPLGYALAKLEPPAASDVRVAVPEGPWCELSKLYVHPDGHGSGAASALLEAVADEAREASVATRWLGVNQLNDRANRFYGKHGLEVVGTRHFEVGGRIEADFVRARRP